MTVEEEKLMDYPRRMYSYEEYTKQDLHAQDIVILRNDTPCENSMGLNFKYLDQCILPDKLIYFEKFIFRHKKRLETLTSTIDVINILQVANQFIEKSFFYSLCLNRDFYISKKTLNKKYSYKEWKEEEKKLFSDYEIILKFVTNKVQKSFQKFLINEENKFYNKTLSLFTKEEIRLVKEFNVDLKLLCSAELYFVLWEIRIINHVDFFHYSNEIYIYLDSEKVIQYALKG